MAWSSNRGNSAPFHPIPSCPGLELTLRLALSLSILSSSTQLQPSVIPASQAVALIVLPASGSHFIHKGVEQGILSCTSRWSHETSPPGLTLAEGELKMLSDAEFQLLEKDKDYIGEEREVFILTRVPSTSGSAEADKE